MTTDTQPLERNERQTSTTLHTSCSSSGCCDHNGGRLGARGEVSQHRFEDDIERGPVMLEHIHLAVHGMAYSSCETHLRKVLSTIRSIRGIKTSLFLAKVEFDVDLNTITVDEVINTVERKTSYSCSRIFLASTSPALDLRIPFKDQIILEELLTAQKPIGVTGITLLDHETLRLHYDAQLVGARTVIETLGKMLNDRILGKEDCCSRKSLYLAPVSPSYAFAAARKAAMRAAGYGVTWLILIAPILVFSWTSFSPNERQTFAFRISSLALATVIQASIIYEVYPSALRSLFYSGLVGMDFLFMFTTAIAYILSSIAFAFPASAKLYSTNQFFETPALLVGFIMLGRLVNEWVLVKATELISMRSLQPAKALLLAQDRQSTTETDMRLFQYGDIFRVPPKAPIMTDGTVVFGGSEVDESMVTGKSMPVAKGIDSQVIAGSINGSGSIDVLLDKLPWENTISMISGMTDATELSKSKTQRLVDKVCGYFVHLVIVITVLVFVIWTLVGRFIQHQAISMAMMRALNFAIATLTASCPCAIGLAVPMVVFIAKGMAVKHGVILRAPESLEKAGNVTHVVLDEAVVLIENSAKVVEEDYQSLLTHSRYTVKRVLMSLLDGVDHPVSRAVVQHLGIDTTSSRGLVDHVKVVRGKGVEGIYNGLVIRAGNVRWFDLESVNPMQRIAENRHSVFCFTIDGISFARFRLEYTVRPDARALVSSLVKRGIKVSLVSGDDATATHSVAMELGISLANAKSRCSPEEKAKYLQGLVKHDPKAVTLFCGDGNNDAEVLKEATVGLQLCDSTEKVQRTADVVLIRPDLRGILRLLEISKAASWRIIFNFVWSAIYNISAVILAAGIPVGLNITIPPQFAALWALLSVFPVLYIAMQLRFIGSGHD